MVHRARFLRRISAFLIDSTIIVIVLQVVGLLLFAPTDGRIRVQSFLLSWIECTASKTNLSDIHLPADFHVTQATLCTKSFSSHVFDRTLTVTESIRQGSGTYTRYVSFPVGPDGRPTTALYTDGLIGIIVFAIYLLFFEWIFGATLGHRILKLRIRPLGGDAITFTQSAKRMLMRFAPLTPYIAISILFSIGLLTIEWDSVKFLAIGYGASSIVPIIWIINLFWTTRRGGLPWHDQWARTELVHVTQTA